MSAMKLHLQNLLVIFVHKGHRVEVQVTGMKKNLSSCYCISGRVLCYYRSARLCLNTLRLFYFNYYAVKQIFCKSSISYTNTPEKVFIGSRLLSVLMPLGVSGF